MQHTNIQAMCSGAEPEFALGEIYGLRQWAIDLWGKLIGHRDTVWPIERKTHIATCKATDAQLFGSVMLPRWASDAQNLRMIYEHVIWSLGEDALDRDGIIDLETSRISLFTSPGRRISHSSRPLSDLLDARHDASPLMPPSSALWNPDVGDAESYPTTTQMSEEWRYGLSLGRREHNVTHPRCTCGFYAYTDWTSLKNNSNVHAEGNNYVYGLIRGHGHATIGTNGFRVERAEIVALTWPHYYSGAYAHSRMRDESVKEANHLSDFMDPTGLADFSIWRSKVSNSPVNLVVSFSDLQDFMDRNNISLGF
jgi:hypothetical protein